jgi:BON domain
LSDLALRSRIIEALADAPIVDVAEIAVECPDDGDVVLRGSVVNLLQRAEAVRTARGVPGVRAVDDQMRTSPTTMCCRRSAASRSRRSLAGRIAAGDAEVDQRALVVPDRVNPAPLPGITSPSTACSEKRYAGPSSSWAS